MRLSHTSDWHIGRTLYGRKRYDEYEAFLNWLAGLIEDEHINVLLVAGDVFDNSSPSSCVRGPYYRFLCCVAVSPHRYAAVKAEIKHSFACGIDIDYNHVKFRSYYNAKQDCHSTRQS